MTTFKLVKAVSFIEINRGTMNLPEIIKQLRELHAEAVDMKSLPEPRDITVANTTLTNFVFINTVDITLHGLLITVEYMQASYD